MLVIKRLVNEAVVCSNGFEVKLRALGKDIVKLEWTLPDGKLFSFWTGADEEIQIGEGFKMVVTIIESGFAKFGFEADHAIEILRKELVPAP